jgi:hypothetical protein
MRNGQANCLSPDLRPALCSTHYAIRSTLYIKPVGKFDQEHIVGFHRK